MTNPTTPTPDPAVGEELPLMAKRLFTAFIVTLFLYITIYGGCQAYRRRGGPWNVTFDLTAESVPELRIEHPRLLGPNPVIFRFPGETPGRTDLPITAVFSVPITNAMPFGPVLFVDTTLLPGTVTLNCFGHVIEMVPRTLYVNLEETSWDTNRVHVMDPARKPDPDTIRQANQAYRVR